jgi:soluble epoxide hydrolase/lipid-phosphate phosphatase
MITAGKDYILTPNLSKNMETWIPNLSRGHVEGGNHWVIQEFSPEVCQILIPWLKSLQNKSKL